ncbi:hypothetical protein DOU54_04705 [Agrobacterium sp. MS2]|nr:hypothetical protein DOU54_04705 [Agrobacterium sp. MS2]
MGALEFDNRSLFSAGCSEISDKRHQINIEVLHLLASERPLFFRYRFHSGNQVGRCLRLLEFIHIGSQSRDCFTPAFGSADNQISLICQRLLSIIAAI